MKAEQNADPVQPLYSTEGESRFDPNAGCGDRPCGRCGRFVFDGQPDPCWGWLPGVEFACCGHDFGVPYITFTNGVTVSFESGLVHVKTETAGPTPAQIDGSEADPEPGQP